MRIHALKIHGWAFPDGVTIDFEAQAPDAQLIAVVGPNGAGKSTLLGTGILGGLYLEDPLYGNLATHAKISDAKIELTFSINGSRFTSKILVNGVSGGVKPFLLDEGGQPVRVDGRPVVDGRVKEWEAWEKEHLPDHGLVMLSAYQAQSTRTKPAASLLTMTHAKRKAAIGGLLGSDRMEETAVGSRAQAADAGSRKDEMRSTIDMVTQSIRDSIAAYRASVRRNLEERGEAEARLDEVPSVEVAQAELAGLSTDLALVTEQYERKRQVTEELRGQVDRFAEDKAARDRHLSRIDRFRDDLKAFPSDFEQTRAELASVKSCESAAGEHLESVREEARERVDAEHRCSTLRNQIGGMEEDIEILGSVPCGDRFPDCKFLTGAVKSREELPAAKRQHGAIQAELDETPTPSQREARISHQAALQAVSRLERVLAREPEAKRIREELAELKEDPSFDRITQEPNRAALLPEMEEEVEEDRLIIAGLTEAHQVAQERLTEARVGGAEHRAAIAASRAALRAMAQSFRESWKKLQARHEVAHDREKELDQDSGDWSILAEAFSKNGLQALEIDRAAPAIEEIVNDLLESCYGNRFRLEVHTTRPDSTGKKMLETAEFFVIDGVKGHAGPVSQFSGGEQIILSEALSLATSVYSARRHGLRWLTPIRDEVTGALDSDHVGRYVAMLRRVIEIAGFERFIVVTHQPEVAELADAVIEVKEGGAALR